MTRPGSYLGIDLGTSGLKVALVREDGELVAEGEASYQVQAARAGWAETDPSVWWAALSQVVEGMAGPLQAHQLNGIGLAGQMHGVVLCDAAGTPLRPAVLWPDRRAETQLPRWRGLPASDRARLANPIVPGMFGPILGWLAEHEAPLVAQAHVALLAKDVLRAGLTGAPVTDRSDASATLLWAVVADAGAGDVAERTGVPVRLLPEVVASDAVTGVTCWLAKTIDGGPQDVPVVAGGGDTPVAMLAAGTGGLQVNLGTGAQVLLAGARPGPVEAPVTHLYGDAEGGWYAMAAVQNAGLALDWVRGILGLDWAELVTVLSAPASVHQTVSFLPFLTGERGALAQPSSRAAWVGMDQATTREDLARAALEALAFSVRRAVELLPPAASASDVGGPSAAVVRLTGGGGREPAMQQLLADVLGREVQRLEVRSSSATGAAVLAARGTGAELVPARQHGPIVTPRRSAALEEAYERWLGRVGTADA
ncbi:MAG: FGGY family carbohydrate kinase [Actinomycetes bacterium]